MIKVTTKCIPQLKRILGNNKYLFFGAKGGGCSGFEYILHPTDDLPKQNDEVISVEDVPMIVCGKSMFLVIGTEIDWKEDYMGQNFHFINPSSTYNFACGKSFMSKHKY